jgi:hypothetical protein
MLPQFLSRFYRRHPTFIMALLSLLPLLLGFFLFPYLSTTTALFTTTRSSNTTSTNSTNCSSPVRDTCTFYPNCLESRYHCGATGYPLGYGLKYCTKFSDERSLLSDKGQQWMINTMMCLQNTLVPDAITTASNITCSAIEETAFGSHARCYVDNGLCELGPGDWAAIVKIVGIATLFESKEAFEATVQAAEGCVGFYAWVVEKGLLDEL